MKLLKHYVSDVAHRKVWPITGLRCRLRRQPNTRDVVCYMLYNAEFKCFACFWIAQSWWKKHIYCSQNGSVQPFPPPLVSLCVSTPFICDTKFPTQIQQNMGEFTLCSNKLVKQQETKTKTLSFSSHNFLLWLKFIFLFQTSVKVSISKFVICLQKGS